MANQEEVQHLIDGLIEDGEWEDRNPSDVQYLMDGIEQDRPWEEGKPYSFEKRNERTFLKNGAKDRSYEVKFNEEWHGKKVAEIQDELRDMFEDVMERAREGLDDQDLGRVIIHHDGLNNNVVVPLQNLGELNADVIMEKIENVLQSEENLPVDDSFYITVGTIEQLKGGKRTTINKVRGENNSVHTKSSMVEIKNEDQMCMARAIGVSWVKTVQVSNEEWKELTKDQEQMTRIEKVLHHKRLQNVMPKT